MNIKKKKPNKKPAWYFKRKPVFIDKEAHVLATKRSNQLGQSLRDYVSGLIKDAPAVDKIV